MNYSYEPTAMVSMKEAQTWPLDRLVDYIIKQYHVGTLARLRSLFSLALECYKKHQLDAPHLKQVYQLIGNLYLSASVHFYHEEKQIFPQIRAMQQAYQENRLMKPTDKENLVETKIEMLEGEHDELEYEYDALIKLKKSNLPPDCLKMFNRLDEIAHQLGEQIHLEDKILFPRAIEMEKAGL